jgi:hypothetical protein
MNLYYVSIAQFLQKIDKNKFFNKSPLKKKKKKKSF